MSLFDNYKPYIYDDLSENERKEIANTIFGSLLQIVLNKKENYNENDSVNDYYGDSVEDYLGSFTKSDMGFLNDLYALTPLYREDVFDKGSKYNKGLLENLIPVFSINFLWKKIQKEYPIESISDIFTEEKKAKWGNAELYLNSVSNISDDLKEYTNQIMEKLGLKVGMVSLDNIYKGKQLFIRVFSFYNLLNAVEAAEHVTQAVSNILMELDTLYTGLFNNNYIGLLFPNEQTAITYSSLEYKNKYGIYVKDKYKYLYGISKSWFQLNSIMSINNNSDSVFLSDTELKSENLYPLFHKKNLKLSNSEYVKERAKLEKSMLIYLRAKSKMGDSEYANCVEELRRKLLSCVILLKDSNQHTLQVRIPLVVNKTVINNNILKELEAGIKGSEDLSILLNPVDEKLGSIQNLTIIYSQSKFDKEVLFAHKLYTGMNAIKPSATNPVLGVKLDGSLYRKALFNAPVTTILAGTRSGKGTLTQSLLAPLIAEGKPIIYLDNKPDIASLFWDLENSFSSKGLDLHFLAIDAKDQASSFTGSDLSACKRGMVESNGSILNLQLPDYLPFSTDHLKLVRNFKTLQLIFTSGEIAANRSFPLYKKIENYVFVDEITNFIQRLIPFYQSIADDEIKDKSPEVKKWVNSFSNVVKDVNSVCKDMATMKKKSQNFNIIMVGQTYSSSPAWGGYQKVINQKIGKESDNFIYLLMRICNNWLSGRLQAAEENGELHEGYSLAPNEAKLSGKTGVFLYHKNKPAGPERQIGASGGIITTEDSDTVQFRSYFALVRNDIEEYYTDVKSFVDLKDEEGLSDYFREKSKGSYTLQYLERRLPYGMEEFANSLDEVYNKTLNEPVKGVGFAGLIENICEILGIDLYTQEMANKLNEPYDALDKILIYSGLKEELGYNYLEEYLYDCRPESFFTMEELIKRFAKGYENNGVYPITKSVYDSDLSNLDDSLQEELKVQQSELEENLIDLQNNEELSKEEKEQRKQEMFADAEKKKIEVIFKDLKAKFREEFNRQKTIVGPRITEVLGKLKKEKDPDIFEIKKGDFTSEDYKKENFFNKFESALSIVKDYPELYVECNQEVTDFINGRYTAIMNLTYDDTDAAKAAKAKSDKEEEKKREKEEKAIEKEMTDVGNREVSEVKKESKTSPATFNGQTITSQIDTGTMQFNTQKLDEMGNVKASRELTNRVIRDIIQQYGGVNNIDEITINGNGALIINGYCYAPQFSESLINSLGLAIKADVQQGKIGRIVNLGQVVAAIMKNIYILSIEDPKTANSSVFKAELGIGKKGYGVLFKHFKNLDTIYLPDQELTRNNPNEQGSGLGLGSKLANLFGFGKGNKDNPNYIPDPSPTNNRDSLTDKIFESKPVRILAGAFGWTMGVKAVVLAATIFGPWGVLFGAFAAAGAYKEIKNDRQPNDYTVNNRQQNNKSQNSSNQNKRKQKSGKQNSNGRNNTGGFNQHYD